MYVWDGMGRKDGKDVEGWEVGSPMKMGRACVPPICRLCCCIRREGVGVRGQPVVEHT